MRRLNILIALFFAVVSVVHAENIQFTAKAPGAVAKGEQFQLVYSVNSDNARDIRMPSIGNFDVIFGPSASSYSSTQYINGKMSREVATSYTFILIAKKEGTFTIPAATVTVGGTKYSSNAVSVRVLPADKSSGQQAAAQGGRASTSTTTESGAKISNQNFFVRLNLSTKKIYEQQYIQATFKVYSRYDFDFENEKYPEFEGFMVEDYTPKTRQLTLETVNGQTYRVGVLRQLLLFPQRTGTIKIGGCKLNAVVRIQSRAGGGGRSIFDDFFETYQDVRKVLTTEPVTVEVLPLPANKPATFNGAVGNFNITSSINRQHLKANESVTVKVVISGNGNLKLLKNPEIKFPADFEVYDPKVTNNIKTTAAGTVGSKVIEYLAIPRFQGKYTIPRVTFSYFDPNSRTYKTHQTQSFDLQVDKGVSGSQNISADYTSKESLKLLGQDISFIKTEKFVLSKEKNYFFGSALYWLLYILPLLAFIVVFVIFRKNAQENANLAFMRTKKANKVAEKRLKLAAKYLKENKKDDFYDEVLKASWGYLSDKLNIPVSALNRDNIESELIKYGAAEEVVKTFHEILDTCEFARYAPVQSSGEMHQTYEKTVDVIGAMEKIIKK
ncbi:BatD family protein [Parabacteroides sp. FAFU027]|uniref:BatD family protein n=1 Tax=Parabacteroides sp. FAFU027 TaxID=2922715 RepID=UPI001FAF2158|nr:BatD family protein [Parabacteroides sp. FAFU027]